MICMTGLSLEEKKNTRARKFNLSSSVVEMVTFGNMGNSAAKGEDFIINRIGLGRANVVERRWLIGLPRWPKPQ